LIELEGSIGFKVFIGLVGLRPILTVAGNGTGKRRFRLFGLNQTIQKKKHIFGEMA
jgi:hypothetical protein